MREFFFLLIVFGPSSAKAASITDALKMIGMKNDQFNKALVVKSFQRKGSTKTFTTIKFEKDKNIYDLEVVSPLPEAEFDRERKNGIGIITSSYNDQPTPYSGEITNIARCPDFFKPKINNRLKFETRTISLVESFIDKDFNFGVCEKKLVKYKVCTSFFYEFTNRQYLKLKVITDPNKDCQNLSLDFYKSLQKI